MFKYQQKQVSTFISQSMKKQAGSAVPFYILPSGIGSASGAYKHFKYSMGDMMAYFKNGYAAWYFPEADVKKAAQFFWKNILQDKNYLYRIIKKSREMRRKLNKLYERINQAKLDNFDKEKIVQIYEELYSTYQVYWDLTSWIDVFDDEGESMLNTLVAKHKEQNSKTRINKYLTALLMPERISYLQQEENDFFELVKKVKNNKKLLSYLRSKNYSIKGLSKDHKGFYQSLQEHRDKYFWSNNDYAKVYNLNTPYFVKQLKQSLPQFRKIESHISQIKKRQGTLLRQKALFLKRETLPKELVKLLWLLNTLTEWRDERKEVTMIQASYFKRFLEFTAKITGIQYDDLIYLNNSEFRSVFFNPVIWARRLSKRRTQGYMYFMPMTGKNFNIEGRTVVILRQKLERSFYQKGKEIQGVVAYIGNVRGRVKVINTSLELKKMRAGEILVAPMTRPEYVSIMKVAKAIITDQGGITCHAAIVSRELGIPCVIGTKIATKVLKDGDLVEVDANQGIIKIIKRR